MKANILIYSHLFDLLGILLSGIILIIFVCLVLLKDFLSSHAFHFQQTDASSIPDIREEPTDPSAILSLLSPQSDPQKANLQSPASDSVSGMFHDSSDDDAEDHLLSPTSGRTSSVGFLHDTDSLTPAPSPFSTKPTEHQASSSTALESSFAGQYSSPMNSSLPVPTGGSPSSFSTKPNGHQASSSTALESSFAGKHSSPMNTGNSLFAEEKPTSIPSSSSSSDAQTDMIDENDGNENNQIDDIAFMPAAAVENNPNDGDDDDDNVPNFPNALDEENEPFEDAAGLLELAGLQGNVMNALTNAGWLLLCNLLHIVPLMFLPARITDTFLKLLDLVTNFKESFLYAQDEAMDIPAFISNATALSVTVVNGDYLIFC
jgi:hypothetical protein